MAAKIDVRPSFFNSLRSTRETELADRFAIHVVCDWIGNSEDIAKRHYLKTTPAHFTMAGEAVHQAVQSQTDTEDNEPKQQLLALANGCKSENQVLPDGLEPSTY